MKHLETPGRLKWRYAWLLLGIAAPMWAADVPPEGRDDTFLLGPERRVIDPLGNDRSPQGLPIVLDGHSQISPVGAGSVVENPDGTLTVERSAGFEADLELQYWIKDIPRHGAAQRVGPFRILLTRFDSIQEPVPPDPDRPLAVDDWIAVAPNAASVLVAATSLLANDSDPNSDPLSIPGASLTQPTLGTVSLETAADGSVINLTYVPGPEFLELGGDSLIYEATDPEGHRDSAVVRFFLEAPPVNHPPIAAPDTFELLQGRSLVVSWSEVLANDFDEDGDFLTVVAILSPDPSLGTLTLTESGFIWQPQVTVIGPVVFTYRAFDGHDWSERVGITLRHHQDGTPPEAVADGPFTVPKYGRVKIFFDDPGNGEPSLFGNDTFPLGAGKPIQQAFSEPLQGRLEFCCDETGSGRSFWYVPEDDFVGQDEFWYTVADTINHRSAAARVTIEVTPVAPDPPPVQPVFDSFRVRPESQHVVLWSEFLANDHGVQRQFRGLSGNSELPHGRVELFLPGGEDLQDFAGYSGGVVYTNQSGETGDFDDGVYRMGSGSDSPSFSQWFRLLLVDESTSSFSAIDDLITTVEGRDVDLALGQLLDNDILFSGSEPEIDPVQISPARFGRVTIGFPDGPVPVGRILYRPPPGFVGIDDFVYRVRDRSGLFEDVVARVLVAVEAGRPTAEPDSATTLENLPIDIDVLANDSDPNPGDSLQISSVAAPTSGSAEIVEAGGGLRVRYLPASGFSGQATFHYSVRDEDSNTASAEVTVTVVANTAPEAELAVFCDGLHCRLDGSRSRDDHDAIVDFAWRLEREDGASVPVPDAESEVLLLLPAAGRYVATLTVTDSGGLERSTTGFFEASPGVTGSPPVADFTYTCAGLQCSFDAGVSTDDVEVAVFEWFFPGSGLPRPGRTASHTFGAKPGSSRQVTLGVSDHSGQYDSKLVSIHLP